MVQKMVIEWFAKIKSIISHQRSAVEELCAGHKDVKGHFRAHIIRFYWFDRYCRNSSDNNNKQ